MAFTAFHLLIITLFKNRTEKEKKKLLSIITSSQSFLSSCLNSETLFNG